MASGAVSARGRQLAEMLGDALERAQMPGRFAFTAGKALTPDLVDSLAGGGLLCLVKGAE
jgi:hypothetical protein